MKLGIMQPYLFPYIGYFQLINSVDKFVIYDDVNFIKQGWINRNRILSPQGDLLFTVPLKKAGSFSKIKEIELNDKLYKDWKAKFFKTLEQTYRKAPYFYDSANVIDSILSEHNPSISDLAYVSLKNICDYLNIQKDFVQTSSIYNNQSLPGTERVIDICKQEKANHYINPIGGQTLYDKSYFNANGLELSFINSLPIEYKQFKNEFIPWLSIIDVIMFNSIEDIQALLNQYKLI